MAAKIAVDRRRAGPDQVIELNLFVVLGILIIALSIG
jgi:hypothetical protein